MWKSSRERPRRFGARKSDGVDDDTSVHTLTFGGKIERYRSENVFFNCCKQGAYVFNTLADFYADAAAALANPNRTTSAVTMRRYQVRYMNLSGLDKPIQPLQVWIVRRISTSGSR